MNKKQTEALETIQNFILWYTSNEQEQEKMQSSAADYVRQDHVLTEGDYKFEIGQKVMWSGSWGTRAPQPAKIIDKGDKNGQPVYDLDNGHWAYEYQLEEI